MRGGQEKCKENDIVKMESSFTGSLQIVYPVLLFLVLTSARALCEGTRSNNFTLLYQNMHWVNNRGNDLRKEGSSFNRKIETVSHDKHETSGGSDQRMVRRKRQIFGQDDRTEVVGSASSRAPLVSSVKVWSDNVQCSGTLIGPCHVITAAHCLHNGKDYVSPLTAYLVGISMPGSDDSLDYFTVDRYFIPPEWYAGKGIIHDHDYALLKLSEPTNAPYLDTAPLKLKPKTQIKMASFPSDKKYGTKWITRCKIGGKRGKFMFQHLCDAVFGSSGAGLFVTPKIAHGKKPVLVGVLASSWREYIANIRKMILLPFHEANTAVRITHDVKNRIDKFVNQSRKCHSM